MNPKDLKDQELLSKTKSLVQKERELLTEVLQHMREIDRRKLFSDLGYRSLFDYAVKELGYSEGQAARRIQALRLMNEIPQVKAKIESGALSLTNISQAQSLFRESKKAAIPMNSKQKLEVLAKLENKSTREAEKVLFAIGFETTIPREKERVISETHTEVRFVITDEVKDKLQVVRALLGIKGANMGWAELISEMANLSAERLEQRSFGKRRAEAARSVSSNDSLGNKNTRHNANERKETSEFAAIQVGNVQTIRNPSRESDLAGGHSRHDQSIQNRKEISEFMADEPGQEQTSRSRNKASEVIVPEHDHEQTRQNSTDTKNEVNLQLLRFPPFLVPLNGLS